MHANKPGSVNVPYPTSANLQDTQEFEVKRTMSGYKETPKNRFSENKKWVITWEQLTQQQVAALYALAASGVFPMIDPLGRSSVVKTMDYKPFHIAGTVGPDGGLLSGVTMELLVINANHSLYAPSGRPLTTPANSLDMMPTLSLPVANTPCYGGNELAFGPVIEGDLANPPLEWNRSARSIALPHGASLPVLRSPALSGDTASVYFTFKTQSDSI